MAQTEACETGAIPCRIAAEARWTIPATGDQPAGEGSQRIEIETTLDGGLRALLHAGRAGFFSMPTLEEATESGCPDEGSAPDDGSRESLAQPPSE